jgi:hypothetical protein
MGFCEHGNEHTVFIKCWNIFEWRIEGRCLRKGSTPLSCTGVASQLRPSMDPMSRNSHYER